MLTSDVWAQLAAPFPADALTHQQLRHDLTENRALVVPRVTLKALYARLDEALGQANWSLAFDARAGAVICGLSLRMHASEWVCKQGVASLGAGTAKTAALAAANEAAAAWGIARDLLCAAPAWVDADQPAAPGHGVPPLTPFSTDPEPEPGPAVRTAHSSAPVEASAVATPGQPTVQEASQCESGAAADGSFPGVLASPGAPAANPGPEESAAPGERLTAASPSADLAPAGARSPRKQRGGAAVPVSPEPAATPVPAAKVTATSDVPEPAATGAAVPEAANDTQGDSAAHASGDNLEAGAEPGPGPALAAGATGTDTAAAAEALAGADVAAEPAAGVPPQQFVIAPEVLADLDVATRAYVDQLIDYASAPGGLRLGIIRDTLTRGKAREKLRDRYPLVLKALLKLVEDRAQAHQQKAA